MKIKSDDQVRAHQCASADSDLKTLTRRVRKISIQRSDLQSSRELEGMTPQN